MAAMSSAISDQHDRRTEQREESCESPGTGGGVWLCDRRYGPVEWAEEPPQLLPDPRLHADRLLLHEIWLRLMKGTVAQDIVQFLPRLRVRAHCFAHL